MNNLAGEAFLKGEIDLLNDDIRIFLVDGIVDVTKGLTLADIDADPNLDRIGDTITLANRSITTVEPVVFKADDVTFTGLPDGGEVDGYYIYKHTGTPSTSPMLFFWQIFGNPTTSTEIDPQLTWDATNPNRVLEFPSATGGSPQSLYSFFRSEIIKGNVDLLTDTIKFVLVTSGYTPSATHTHLDDVPSGNRVATSGALPTANRVITPGFFRYV